MDDKTENSIGFSALATCAPFTVSCPRCFRSGLPVFTDGTVFIAECVCGWTTPKTGFYGFNEC